MKPRLNLRVPSPIQLLLAHLVVSILAGFLWYCWLYSPLHLYFTHVNWIYRLGGDVLQHQLGWEWFRYETWQFPLGKITAYGYPIGTSVTYMDAIPLLAIPMKLVAPWFKPNFQYFGIWELLSVVGQMLAGMLIFNEFTRSFPLKTLGASLLVLSPPMIFRAFYHSSLSAHWIILFGILFVILEYRQKLWRGAWFILFGLAVTIHIYFIPLLMPLWLISLFFRYRREEKTGQRLANVLLDSGAVFLVIISVGYSIGLFSLSYGSLSVSGFGVFSWNLNGLFNPYETSRYIKELPNGLDQQYEGYSYLGLANLMVLPIALYWFFEKSLYRGRLLLIFSLSAAAVIYVVFALSNKAFIGERLLWDIQLPGAILKFCNLFRASGRFIWPVFYLLVIFGVVVVMRNVRFPVAVFGVLVLVQVIDIQPLYQEKKLTDLVSYQSPLQSEIWKTAAETNKHIVIIPERKLRQNQEPIAMLAVRNHLTLNLGYFARNDTAAFKAYGEQTWADLQSGQVDADTVYILTDPEWITFAKERLSKFLYVCNIDEFTVLFSPLNSIARTGLDLSPDCSIPIR